MHRPPAGNVFGREDAAVQRTVTNPARTKKPSPSNAPRLRPNDRRCGTTQRPPDGSASGNGTVVLRTDVPAISGPYPPTGHPSIPHTAAQKGIARSAIASQFRLGRMFSPAAERSGRLGTEHFAPPAPALRRHRIVPPRYTPSPQRPVTVRSRIASSDRGASQLPPDEKEPPAKPSERTTAGRTVADMFRTYPSLPTPHKDARP